MLSAFSRAFENKTSSHFDKVLTALEEIILSPEFDEIDTNFLEQHCEAFDTENPDDNKLEYTEIFKKYEKLGDETLTSGLQEKLGSDFDMERFNQELVKFNQDGCLDEIQEMLKCFTDFVAFKEKMFDFKRFQSGAMDDLGACLVVSQGAGPSSSTNVSGVQMDLGLGGGDSLMNNATS